VFQNLFFGFSLSEGSCGKLTLALVFLSLFMPALSVESKASSNHLLFELPDAGTRPTQGVALEIGNPIEREIAGGQQYDYQITLNEGQYASIIVEQGGIDVLVRVLGVDTKPVAEFDLELRNHGMEAVELVAESAGTYRVVVEAKGPKESTGRFEIRLVELRAAAERDRSLQEARSLLAESASLRRAGKYDQAIPPGERAIEIRESVLGTDHPLVANSITSLGEILRFKGDYTRAEQLHNRALEIRENTLGAEHPDVASSLNNLAIINYFRGKFDEAEQLYRRALEKWEQALGPEHPLVAASLQNLAIVHAERGDYDNAEQLYKRALAIREKVLGPEHRDVATTLNNLAIVYEKKGDYEKTEQLYKRAIQIREKVLGPEHPDLAPSLQNLAIVCRRRSDYDQAELLLKRALKIYEKALGSEHPLVATSLNNLAMVYLDRGDYASSEELCQRALTIREKALGPEHPNVASTLHNLAIIYRHRGDYLRAEQLNLRAIAIAAKALGPEHPNISEMLNDLAINYAAKGDLAQAVTTQMRAEKIIEHNIILNLVTSSERQKLAYLASLSEPTDRTLSLHLRTVPNNVDACGLAATTILQRKGRVLDALADSVTTLRLRFSEQDQQLLDQMNDATSQLARLVLNGPQRTTTTAEHQKRIKALEEQREEIEAEISRRSAEFRAGSQPVTLDAVQAAIPANTALIEFAIYSPFDPKAKSKKAAFGQPRYVAYIIRQQGELRWKELGDGKAIDCAVDELRKGLRDNKRKDVARLARAVDELVMRPVRALLGDATHLLVSPDGALNLIPFEALVDERGQYLVQQYAFTYLTSGRDLLRLQVARASKSNPVIVANPLFGESELLASAKPNTPNAHRVPFDRKRPQSIKRQSVLTVSDLSDVYFAPLEGTKHEGQSIRSRFTEASLLTGTQASESALKKIAAPRVLHIATHGFFLTDNPPSSDTRGTRAINATVKIENPLLRSGLALAGANLRKDSNDDGILTAMEAAGLNLWGTKLVTLSACDTGLGEVRNGEGVYGLRRAFVLAGTETLVMSLWPVSDFVTREMMTAYYDALKQGLGRGESLRQVQLSMLKRKGREHPFYWGSFIQSGEWANLDGKR
jgi:CHAT domain-containing protein/Tfp pilus assembly protein PilF